MLHIKLNKTPCTSFTSCRNEYGSSVAFFSFFLPCSLRSAAVKNVVAPPLLVPVSPFFNDGLADFELDFFLLFFDCASSISVPLSGTTKESSSESAIVDERR